MNLDIRQRWIDAAIILGHDPHVKVLCPSCQKDYLKVLDVPFDKDSNKFERYLNCKACGKYNVILMTKEGDSGDTYLGNSGKF